MKQIIFRCTGALICLMVLSVGVHFSIVKTVDFAVGVDATRKALKWSDYLVKRIPDLPDLIATGVPSKKQIAEIKITAKVGDVFRFKLFNASGNLVLISDEVNKNLEVGASGDHNGNAAKVLATGENQISLNDGTAKKNRPDLYVEAYVPVKGDNGNIIGVVEVYLDQTSVSHLFRNLFSLLALGIAILLAVMFSAPYAGYLYMSRKERQSRSEANYLAHNDRVANLPNRAGIMKLLDTRQTQGRLNLDRASVIFLDIDQFKLINDTYGHNAGDAFINHVGEGIRASLGPDDLAGRMGGDEFLIIAERHDAEEILALVERIQSLVSNPLRREGTTIIGHLSIGIYNSDGQSETIESRMQKADIALYQAKFDGRNVYRVFTPDMEAKALRRRMVEGAILSGLDNNRFEVYYQPLLRQSTRKCVGFEALLRLQSKDGVSISPEEFIPIAEEMGEIGKISLWVLETALQEAANWPSSLFVSVNLSAKQFDDNLLVENIKKLLDTTGVDPTRLELEITESLLMENTDSIAAQLSALRELGVSVAMDDFGTGYSSLGYLWQFGFDKLKIDQSFIKEIEEGTDKVQEILDTIILLGHRLGMTVTAEGIETEQQARVLSGLECDHFQGFLYSKPMPADNLAAFLLNSVVETIENKEENDAASKTA